VASRTNHFGLHRDRRSIDPNPSRHYHSLESVLQALTEAWNSPRTSYPPCTSPTKTTPSGGRTMLTLPSGGRASLFALAWSRLVAYGSRPALSTMWENDSVGGETACPACSEHAGFLWSLERDTFLLLTFPPLLILFVITGFAAKFYHAKERSLAKEWYSRGQAELAASLPFAIVRAQGWHHGRCVDQVTNGQICPRGRHDCEPTSPKAAEAKAKKKGRRTATR
jgi:hypothetical protein